ncbi:MAG TPA: type II toxin-antitoxin system VapC family toxin [Terracidiphilus sp.]|jgi:PIN domain nuclease of toxin-antitoxin system|nr:type II toxin-antitoxin system VapC family toxin [Terracidiphilus sp.]
MRFLLDTHLLIWVAISDPRLRPTVRAVLNDKANRFFFSVSSIWEIAIKSALKRRDFLYNPREIRRQFIENGYEELPILGHHVVAVDSLAPIHKDPFDRILIAQAMVEGITLLTADPVIAKYPGPIRKI